jgi:hypothetical protein
MRIKVEIKGKVYEIGCGTGWQDLAWLALSACYLYGKETYPRGFHQPTLLLYREDIVPHPRSRINASLHDGDEVSVILRDPSQPQPKKHQKWYKRAFGEDRNIMKFEIRYFPKTIDFASVIRTNSVVYAVFNFTMFPELEEDFKYSNYQSSYKIELKPKDKARREFSAKIFLPFGENTKIRLCDVTPQKDVENPDPKDLPQEEQNCWSLTRTPEPWSKSQQKEEMKKEEKEHGKREEEAMKKAQEQMQRIEANPATPIKTLYDVWPDAPSALAPHFPMLYDVFSIYANYHLPEEDMISAHDFFHFLRTFDLVTDSDDMIQIILELGDDIEGPRAEVLKPKISITLFLILLVKFAEIRNPEDTGFNNLIEKMTESKAIWLQDYVKAQIIKPDISELFMENCEDLTIKYLSKATRVEGIVVDLKINDFISMVMDCEQLTDFVNPEKLKQICEDTLFFNSFKDSQILYADFLENLVRLAQAVPFNEEEISQNFANQTETVILAEKLHSIIRILCGTKAPPSAGSRGFSRGNFK